MTTKRIPEKVILTCDGCHEEVTDRTSFRGRGYGCQIIIGRDAYDFQGGAFVDASITLDLCRKCSRLFEGAVNEAFRNLHADPTVEDIL